MSRNNRSESQKLEALKGHRLGPYLSHNPVSPTQIWQWCSAMGDYNPLYRPGPRQLAPPAMMQMWTMRDVNDCYAPGSTEVFPYRVFEDMAAWGYPANVAVSYDLRFFRYLRVGERARHYTTIQNVSERKTTALGTGYFVTERVEYLTQEDDAFAEALITYFQYAPATESTARGEQGAPGGQAPLDTAAKPIDRRACDYRDIAVSRLAVGEALPESEVPITHRLIVAGAIATQDFTPVHHSEPAAQSAGMPDIFMNILTTCGLSIRYLTDWAGSGSRVKQITFKLMAPNLPGDVMRLNGKVIAITPDARGALVDIAFTGENSLGTHISGTATLAVPSTIG